MEQNKRVSSVFFNTNVRNVMWVRLPEAGREGMTPPQLSLQKWQPPGEPRPGWTPSLQSRSPPPSTTTQHSPHLSSSGAQKDRRLICNTYKLRGSGQTHCPHQASVSSSVKQGDTPLTFLLHRLLLTSSEVYVKLSSSKSR